MTEAAWALAAGIIRQFEGLSLTPYRDAVGHLTVGYGHRLADEVEPLLAGACTLEQVEALLAVDLYEAMGEVEALGVALADHEAAALASLIFNIGRGAWRNSTIRKKVAAGDRAGAAGEFGRWVYAGGQVLPGLVKRRAEEAALFMAKEG
jgi:lysozyme